MFCIDGKGKVDLEKKKKITDTTLLHEMFHAYFHYVTTEQGKCSYNYIFEIEEAMTEFCSLVCLQDMSFKDPTWRDVFDDAVDNIREWQNNVGKLAAYGFGAYLFDNLKEESDRYNLINSYIKKLGHINEKDSKVKEYCEKIHLSKYVQDNQDLCLKLLKEILKL